MDLSSKEQVQTAKSTASVVFPRTVREHFGGSFLLLRNFPSAADEGEPDAIPSEPHCLASIRDNLEKLFGTLPTCNQEVYSQTSAMESSVDMAASPFQSLSSLGVEPSSLDVRG